MAARYVDLEIENEKLRTWKKQDDLPRSVPGSRVAPRKPEPAEIELRAAVIAGSIE